MTGRSLWLLPNPLDASATHDPLLFQDDALHGLVRPGTGAPRWVSFDAADAATHQVFVRTMPGLQPGNGRFRTPSATRRAGVLMEASSISSALDE
jgi:hypothetical protein